MELNEWNKPLHNSLYDILFTWAGKVELYYVLVLERGLKHIRKNKVNIWKNGVDNSVKFYVY